MDSPENNIGSTLPGQTKSPSLLDQIIETSHQSSAPTSGQAEQSNPILTTHTNPL